MRASLQAMVDAMEHGTVRAVVSDLDGVLRVFGDELWPRLDGELALAEGTTLRSVLGHPIVPRVIRGEASFGQWREAAARTLVELGASAQEAGRAVGEWARTPAVVDEEVRALLTGARSRGLAVLVLTNGTDRILQEVLALQLQDVVGEQGEFLLSSHQIGHAKPEPEAYAAAQRRIEQIAGAPLPAPEVQFLDDTSANVAAAAEFGWQAHLHR